MVYYDGNARSVTVLADEYAGQLQVLHEAITHPRRIKNRTMIDLRKGSLVMDAF